MTNTDLHRQYFTPDFDQVVNNLLDEYKLPGVSVAVVQDDRIATQGYGVTKPEGAAVTGDTIFDCASMSKSFTAAAVALLVDDENYPAVNWKARVSALIPDDFVLPEPSLTAQVTITDILSHRTGMVGVDEICMSRNSEYADTPKSVTRKLRHLTVTKPIRTAYQYNNEMFTAASHLVEVVSGEPFFDLLQRRFWDPLDMKATFHSREQLHDHHEDLIAQPSYWSEKDGSYQPITPTSGPEGQGAGEIISTAADYAKWVRAMIQGTTGISQESVSQMHRPIIVSSTTVFGDDDPNQSELFYGMGWHVEYYRGYKVLNHAGMVPGMTSLMGFVLKLKFGFVMFGNSDGLSHGSDIIWHRLLDDRLDVAAAERVDWPSWKREWLKKEAQDEEGDKPFPNRPSQPLPMTLPIERYTGRFEHPAYGVLDVEVKDGKLYTSAADRKFPYEIGFEHVSADYFVAEVSLIPPNEKPNESEAQFRVDVSGGVTGLGIRWLDVDDDDDDGDGQETGWVWFRRRGGE